ncbi:MAG TPA: hypothetical protein H9668_00145 [Firmicutes bacterium]|nr:hypothetical protein [Bacillota bacterium]
MTEIKKAPCPAATRQGKSETIHHTQSTTNPRENQVETRTRIKYPNLLAEYQATGYTLGTLCDHANVTQELMQAILDGEEEPMLDEMRRLYALFSDFDGFSGYSFDYFCSPVLAVVRPYTNKGIARAHKLYTSLEQAVDAANKWGASRFDLERLRRAVDVFCKLRDGHMVTYAQYRHALNDADAIYRTTIPKAKRDRRGIAAH